MPQQPKPDSDVEGLTVAYHRYGAEKRDEDYWAWAEVAEIARSRDRARAWEVMLAVVRTAPDDRLSVIGAGPLEDFIETHGAHTLDDIVREARDDARFREALSSMWLVREDFSPAVLARLLEVTGHRIEVADQASIDAAQIDPLGRADTNDG
jgi:hypothetical protein